MNHFEELDVLNPSGSHASQSLNGYAHAETPTPHKVSVLVLIQQYLNAKKFACDCGVTFPNQSRRNFCMLLLKLIQYPDMTYSDLNNLLTSARYRIDTQHFDAFEKTMSDIFSMGIDALTEFADMQNMQKLISEQLGVNQFSIVGVYVRRVGITLSSMSFPEMLSLHKSICLYYEKGIRTLAIGPNRMISDSMLYHSGKSGTLELDDTLEDSVFDRDTVHTERTPHSKWSLKQAELFVTQQCKMLENNELRALPPIELQSKVNEIIQDSPINSRAYFCAYMNQLRLRDYYGATDALHRAFDRSPLQMMKQFDFKGFQYFSVNLAIMHASFNHHKESTTALKECIMLAQESGDKRCLNLANTWYCLLNMKKMELQNRKACELHDPYVIQSITMAIHFMVKFGAQCGTAPLDLFALLMKTDELNHKLDSALEYQTESLALRSALWSLYGSMELSSLYSQVLLNLRQNWAFGDVGNSECVCKVLANLAMHLNIQGEPQLSAVVLDHAQKRFPRYPISKSWLISECHILIQQAVYRSQWQEAIQACHELYLLDPNAGNLQHAHVLLSKRHFKHARCILYRLLRTTTDVLTHVRVLLLLAYSTISDQEAWSSETIGLLMRASVIAATAYLDYEHALIDMTLAQVMLKMGMPQKALQAISNCMEKIYTNGGIYDCAKADFTLVRCAMAAETDMSRRRQLFQRALVTLEYAAESFKTLEVHAKVLDIYAYAAKMSDELADVEQRNTYAGKFKQYYVENDTPREYLGMEY